MNEHPDRSSVADNPPLAEIKSTTAPWNSRSHGSPGETKRRHLGFLFLLFGVLYPLGTLGYELYTHGCAELLFDPIPTWWHVGLVVAVPLSNFLIWRGLRDLTWRPSKALTLLAGASIGISAIYGAMFAPLAPFAVMGIIFYGIGLLPLAPMVAFLATTVAWWKMPAKTDLTKRWFPGFALGVAVLAVPYGWDLVTYELLGRATAGSPEQRRAAVTWLRNVGHREAVLVACYRDPKSLWSFLGEGRRRLVSPFDQAEVQKVYYRLTGVAYNSRPIPKSVSTTGRGMFREFSSFDRHVGGERVADKVAGLTLEGSRLNAKIDPVGLTSYTEWTLVFKNVAADPNEARAQIELPPGGVVSRLTLWINGEPREAAFGGRGQVRAAYQEVAVVQRRDPVLVTTSGPDRVLMQCFPVPPDGGEMKVRLGITAPLRIHARDRAGMSWPSLLETNFQPGTTLQHVAGAESSALLANGQKTFQAQWNDGQLGNEEPLQVPIGPEAREVIADDPADPTQAIRQTITEVNSPKPSRTVFVIDVSRTMKPFRKNLTSALGGLKATEASVLFAGDFVERWPASESLLNWIEDREFDGGRDNLPALEAAWEEAAREPGGAIVWIHGPQPVLLGGIDPLRRRIEESTSKPAFYLASHGAVQNLVADKVSDLVTLIPLRDATNLEDRLERWLPYGLGGHARLEAKRERIARASLTSQAPNADRHVARVWGREEVERIRATPAKLDEAIKLALSLQLVTPVSGAVVLERQEQYDRHGLNPADPNSVPTVPEPATASLVAVALLWYGLRRPRRIHA